MGLFWYAFIHPIGIGVTSGLAGACVGMVGGKPGTAKGVLLGLLIGGRHLLTEWLSDVSGLQGNDGDLRPGTIIKAPMLAFRCGGRRTGLGYACGRIPAHRD